MTRDSASASWKIATSTRPQADRRHLGHRADRPPDPRRGRRRHARGERRSRRRRPDGRAALHAQVSSPGVGRPLTEPRHFRRNVGRLVTASHGGHEVTGRVVRASSTEVTLQVPATRSTPARTETLPYAALERAAVQVEFARPDDKDSRHGHRPDRTARPRAERGISMDVLIPAIEQAIVLAYQRTEGHFRTSRAELDRKTRARRHLGPRGHRDPRRGGRGRRRGQPRPPAP